MIIHASQIKVLILYSNFASLIFTKILNIYIYIYIGTDINKYQRSMLIFKNI